MPISITGGLNLLAGASARRGSLCSRSRTAREAMAEKAHDAANSGFGGRERPFVTASKSWLPPMNRLNCPKAPGAGCPVWRAGKAAPVAVHQGRLDVAAHRDPP
jgi:hypothetical protein